MMELFAKIVKSKSFSGPYFSTFGLDTGKSISLPIQSEFAKIRTRKNLTFGHFSRSEIIDRILNTHLIIIAKRQPH